MKVDRCQNVSFKANPIAVAQKGAKLADSVVSSNMIASKSDIKIPILHKLLGYNAIIMTDDGFKFVKQNSKGVVRKAIIKHTGSSAFEKEGYDRHGIIFQRKEFEKKTVLPDPKKVTLYNNQGNPTMEETRGPNFREVINYADGQKTRHRVEVGYSIDEKHYDSQGQVRLRYFDFNDGHHSVSSVENYPEKNKSVINAFA